MKKIISLTCLLFSPLSYSMHNSNLEEKEFNSWLDKHAPYPTHPPLDFFIDTMSPNNKRKSNTVPNIINKKSKSKKPLSYMLQCHYDYCDYKTEHERLSSAILPMMRHIYQCHNKEHIEKINKILDTCRIKTDENNNLNKIYTIECTQCDITINTTNFKKLRIKTIIHFFCTQKHNKKMYDELKDKIEISI